jgi:hypothetical protein
VGVGLVVPQGAVAAGVGVLLHPLSMSGEGGQWAVVALGSGRGVTIASCR